MGCWTSGSLGAGGTAGNGVSGNATDDPPDRAIVHLWPTGQPEVFEILPSEMARVIGIPVTFCHWATVTVGAAEDLWMPFAGTIKEVRMLATGSGSVQVAIWKTPYGLFPPTATNSITASATPSIVSSDHSRDATLTGWTTAIAVGDVLRFRVDSAVNIMQVTCELKVERI